MSYGSVEQPLRCSKLGDLVQCTLRAQMLSLNMLDDEAGGKAADTGSAVHMAARSWHKTKDEVVAVAVMRQMLEEYPLADLGEAAKLFRLYAADPRNRDADIVLLEAQVELALEAHSSDPTGEEIVIFGTVDQVRMVNGQLEVFDIKTGGRLYGYQMVLEHAYQMAGYMLGAAKKLGKRVWGANVIRVKDYLKGDKVFWPCPFGEREAQGLMEQIKRAVAVVRSGVGFANPGDHCRWCPAGGVDRCSQWKEQA